MGSTKLSHLVTGVSVPVSALRGAKGCGTGEFADLVDLGAWCAASGIELIQLLPVNDTGWNSSPYSALSAFALHPLYLRLTDVPGSAPFAAAIRAFADSAATGRQARVQGDTGVQAVHSRAHLPGQRRGDPARPGVFPVEGRQSLGHPLLRVLGPEEGAWAGPVVFVARAASRPLCVRHRGMARGARGAVPPARMDAVPAGRPARRPPRAPCGTWASAQGRHPHPHERGERRRVGLAPLLRPLLPGRRAAGHVLHARARTGAFPCTTGRTLRGTATGGGRTGSCRPRSSSTRSASTTCWASSASGRSLGGRPRASWAGSPRPCRSAGDSSTTGASTTGGYDGFPSPMSPDRPSRSALGADAQRAAGLYLDRIGNEDLYTLKTVLDSESGDPRARGACCLETVPPRFCTPTGRWCRQARESG